MFYELIQGLLTSEMFVEESSKVILIVASIIGDVAITAIICVGVIYYMKNLAG